MTDPPPDLRILDDIAIDKPCLVPWDEIQGTGPTRSCQVCRKNVFDLIELSTATAAQILSESDELPCVRICRAPDGRILTADNPTGFRMRVWRGLQRRSGWAASLFVLLFLPGCQTWMNSILQYGAPARPVKSTEQERTISDDSAQPKIDTNKNPD